jgi:hypothetical protein
VVHHIKWIMRRAGLCEVPPCEGLVFADLGVLRSA